MIRCDVCHNVVRESEAAMIVIRPGGVAKKFVFPNANSKTVVAEESFDLCKTCVMKTLRKYYGPKFGEGVVDT